MLSKINNLLERRGVKMTLVLISIVFTVYFVLFSPYPAIHDALHEFRHSVGVPCH